MESSVIYLGESKRNRRRNRSSSKDDLKACDETRRNFLREREVGYVRCAGFIVGNWPRSRRNLSLLRGGKQCVPLFPSAN